MPGTPAQAQGPRRRGGAGLSSGPTNGPGEVAAAERDARAVQLRASGASYRTIARELHIATSTAYDAVQAGLQAVRREPSEHLIELEAAHLDRLRREALDVLTARHPLVQAGEIVHDTDGHELHDAGPVIAAIRALLGIAERRAKLLGLDAPTRVDLRATLAHAWAQATLEERDWVIEQEIAELREEQARRHPGPPTPPVVETMLPEPAPPGDQAEILARTVEAALDAAGVPPEAREPAYRAVEHQLRHRGTGGPR
jgi:hypothetical protein